MWGQKVSIIGPPQCKFAANAGHAASPVVQARPREEGTTTCHLVPRERQGRQSSFFGVLRLTEQKRVSEQNSNVEKPASPLEVAHPMTVNQAPITLPWNKKSELSSTSP